jgi:hypothetical protein
VPTTSALPQQQKETAADYQSYGSWSLNRWLRGETMEGYSERDLQALRVKRQRLDAAIARSRIPENVLVYRRTSVPNAAHYKAGDIFPDAVSSPPRSHANRR